MSDEADDDEVVCYSTDGTCETQDYCDLYEASEIGSPCAGLCHLAPHQPHGFICRRCGTSTPGPEGAPCPVCVPAPGQPPGKGRL